MERVFSSVVGGRQYYQFMEKRMINRKNAILLGITGIVLVALTAGASAYIVTKTMHDDKVVTETSHTETIKWKEQRAAVQPQPQQPAEPACDDANIVGAAIGAVGGGLVGNQIGSGKGQDLATIGGAIGGGYLGKEYIPTHNTLCPD